MQNDGFNKFTERARNVLTLAQEEATRFKHNYIGTEHLLLGLIREEEGVARSVLSSLSVDLEQVRGAVESIIGRGDRLVIGENGLTPRAKKVIELAVEEARRLGHHYIGTEHILLGLVREGEGIAANVLRSLGVNLEKVRTQTIQVLSGASAASSPAPPPDRGNSLSGLPHAITWEYLDVQVGYLTPDSDGTIKTVNGQVMDRFGTNSTPVQDGLNTLGAEGWELVAIDTSNGQSLNDSHYRLKRPASSSIAPWLTWLAQEIVHRGALSGEEEAIARRVAEEEVRRLHASLDRLTRGDEQTPQAT